MLPWTLGCSFRISISFSLDKYLEVGYLDHVIAVLKFFFFLRNVYFPQGVPIYIPSNSMLGFPFLHSLIKHLFFVVSLIVILTGVRWSLFVVLICISLIISDAQHLFIYILVFCMSPLEECLSKSLAHF